jgi:hypothetical protein
MPLGEWTRRLGALPAEAYDCFMVGTLYGVVFVQTSHVEVTLETLTVDRKFLISASSDKQNQIVPSAKDTARPSESRLSPCHSSECHICR